MDNSNKAIAKRINKELKSRDWAQVDLLKEIIKFKFPNINKTDLYSEVNARKGNFSTALKPNSNNKRSISKEDLYIISKVFGLPLEYIMFGDEKKSGFIPQGARYAAFQDSDSEYRTYIASLEHEDHIQHPDEFGFNLFNYFGQFDSINGYRFFQKNYHLFFNYSESGLLSYVNSEGYEQSCSYSDEKNLISDNLISTLVEYNDLKTFKAIYFDNCPLKRFGDSHPYPRSKALFGDDFLETLLQNEPFLDLTLRTKEVELNSLNKAYEKGEKRVFVEPLFFEAVAYALKHEKEYKDQILKMLRFALTYNKSQYIFVKDYLKTHSNEHGDARIEEYAPRILRSSRNIILGSVIELKAVVSSKEIRDLLNEIEQYVFNITHIINEQERNNETIKISTPDNALFIELHKNGVEKNVDFLPTMIHSDNEFTYYQYYESTTIGFDDIKQLQFVINCISKAQCLVEQKAGKVLVHGDFNGPILMTSNGAMVGLAGWQKCHYGNKYEDRAELLSNIDIYLYGHEYIEKFKSIFDVISQGFTEEERIKLINITIDLLAEKRKSTFQNDSANISQAYWLKERSSKLEFFKEIYLEK